MSATTRRLVRPRRGRIIAGVCRGIAERFGMPAWLVRLLAIVSCVLPGPQFLIYVICWIVVPNE